MTDKKMERRPSIDPAVADLLAGMEQRQAEAALPKKEREKKAREKAKISSPARSACHIRPSAGSPRMVQANF